MYTDEIQVHELGGGGVGGGDITRLMSTSTYDKKPEQVLVS